MAAQPLPILPTAALNDVIHCCKRQVLMIEVAMFHGMRLGSDCLPWWGGVRVSDKIAVNIITGLIG